MQSTKKRTKLNKAWPAPNPEQISGSPPAAGNLSSAAPPFSFSFLFRPTRRMRVGGNAKVVEMKYKGGNQVCYWNGGKGWSELIPCV